MFFLFFSAFLCFSCAVALLWPCCGPAVALLWPWEAQKTKKSRKKISIKNVEKNRRGEVQRGAERRREVQRALKGPKGPKRPYLVDWSSAQRGNLLTFVDPQRRNQLFDGFGGLEFSAARKLADLCGSAAQKPTF